MSANPNVMQAMVIPPSLMAYYFNDANCLIVVESIKDMRQIEVAPEDPNWQQLLQFDENNAGGAHVDPDTAIEVAGLATKALYVLCLGSGERQLVATEALAGVSRQVRPPHEAAPGGVCRCMLVPCGAGRLCCPCR